MYIEWYGVCDCVVLSVVEVCVDYGVGVCDNVCGVVCCLFLTSGCCYVVGCCAFCLIRDASPQKSTNVGNSKHSKNNLKIYVILFVNFFSRWTDNIVFFYMSVNKSSYIYLIILLFD